MYFCINRIIYIDKTVFCLFFQAEPIDYGLIINLEKTIHRSHYTT